jgi:hypothetical protein
LFKLEATGDIPTVASTVEGNIPMMPAINMDNTTIQNRFVFYLIENLYIINFLEVFYLIS